MEAVRARLASRNLGCDGYVTKVVYDPNEQFATCNVNGEAVDLRTFAVSADEVAFFNNEPKVCRLLAGAPSSLNGSSVAATGQPENWAVGPTWAVRTASPGVAQSVASALGGSVKLVSCDTPTTQAPPTSAPVTTVAVAAVPSTTTAPPPVQLAPVGTYTGRFPTGQSGVVSVVAHSPTTDGFGGFFFVARNNMTETSELTQVTVTATSPSGTVLGSQEAPLDSTLSPGQVGWGKVVFNGGLPSNTKFSFQVNATTPEQSTTRNIDNLQILQYQEVNGAITGIVKSVAAQGGGADVSALCVDSNGTPLDIEHATTSDIPAGGQASFQDNLYGTPCSLYLLVVTGWAPT